MSEQDLANLTSVVLWLSFGVAVVFGYLTQRSNFCTMGAVADIVNMGEWTRARMWMLAAGVAIVGFGLLGYLGVIDPGKSIYTSPRLIWLSNLTGGLLFGFGMVLASGCGSKTLIRIGGGSLKALMVFFVLGVAAFATMRGITAVLRVNTVDAVALTLSGPQDLPSLLAAATGASRPLVALLASLAIGGALIGFGLLYRRERGEGWMLAGGLGVGATVVALWAISGKLGFVAEHPKTLEEVFVATSSGRMESLTFVAPVAYTLDWLMFYSDKSKVLTIGVATVAGVIVGAFVAAKHAGSFRWEGFRDVEDMGNHFVGAVLMGIGGVTAFGCTVGQGLSGLSTLALGSFVAVGGIVGGAYLGIKYQMWRLERQS